MLRIAEGDAFWEGLKMAFAPRIQLINKEKIKTILDPSTESTWREINWHISFHLARRIINADLILHERNFRIGSKLE